MSFTILTNSIGNSVIASNSILNSSGTEFNVADTVLDVDGNSFPIFTASVIVTPGTPGDYDSGDPSNYFILRENRVFIL